jgi:hypothetical protein
MISNVTLRRINKDFQELEAGGFKPVREDDQIISTRIPDMNNCIVRFTYPKDYPFNPPRVEMNNKSVNRVLNWKTGPFARLYEKKFQTCACFCCRSFLCSSNWSPAITSLKIIKQLSAFYHQKQQILYEKPIEQIKAKYNIPEELNLVGFL